MLFLISSHNGWNRCSKEFPVTLNQQAAALIIYLCYAVCHCECNCISVCALLQLPAFTIAKTVLVSVLVLFLTFAPFTSTRCLDLCSEHCVKFCGVLAFMCRLATHCFLCSCVLWVMHWKIKNHASNKWQTQKSAVQFTEPGFHGMLK